MARIKYSVKRKILELYYRTELRKGELRVNNGMPEIAKEVNMKENTVWYIVESDMKEKKKRAGVPFSDYLNNIDCYYKDVGAKSNKKLSDKDIKQNKIEFEKLADKEPQLYFNP